VADGPDEVVVERTRVTDLYKVEVDFGGLVAEEAYVSAGGVVAAIVVGVV